MTTPSQSIEDYHYESNEEDDDYSYSDESLWINDFDARSEVTNVTARSSLSGSTSSFESDQSSKLLENKNKLNQPQRCFSSPGFHSNSNNPRRKNMSFSNVEMMRIERDNQLLLRKIMAQQKNTKIVPVQVNSGRPSSSAINRQRLQRKIEEENMVFII